MTVQNSQPNNAALLPCPFCDEAVRMHAEGEYYQVICQDCGSKAAEYPNSTLATLAWNTRASMTSPSQPTSPSCPRCSECEGEEHHWMQDCDEETGEPVMVCKHCEATREIADDDFDY